MWFYPQCFLTKFNLLTLLSIWTFFFLSLFSHRWIHRTLSSLLQQSHYLWANLVVSLKLPPKCFWEAQKVWPHFLETTFGPKHSFCNFRRNFHPPPPPLTKWLILKGDVVPLLCLCQCSMTVRWSQLKGQGAALHWRCSHQCFPTSLAVTTCFCQRLSQSLGVASKTEGLALFSMSSKQVDFFWLTAEEGVQPC